MALPHPRLIAAGVALVLAFGAGWAVQGWRMGAEYAALEMRHALRLAQAHENALTEYARLEKVKNDAIRPTLLLVVGGIGAIEHKGMVWKPVCNTSLILGM